MIGSMKGPVLLSLNDDPRNPSGIAIIDGVSLRVTWSGKSEQRWIGRDGRQITLVLNVTDVLDEEQQRKKIARLESELENEREKLTDMKAIFDGEAYATRNDE